MNKFSKGSEMKIGTLCQSLQKLVRIAIELIDFAVIDGHRDEKTQNRYFKNGISKLRYPSSKHNNNPSLAMDLFPEPYIWSNTEAFYRLASVVFGVAEYLDIEIVWGGHWESLKDLPHFEIKEQK